MYSIIAKHRILSLHILVLILGLTGVLGKLITLEAIHLVWWRMLIAFVGLAIFLAVKKELFKIKKRDFLNILGIGVIVTLHWLCFFQSTARLKHPSSLERTYGYSARLHHKFQNSPVFLLIFDAIF